MTFQHLGQLAVILLAFIALLGMWLAWMERCTMTQWRQFAKERAAMTPRPADPLPPIEWDDHLDVSHLQVKHEPSKEQP